MSSRQEDCKNGMYNDVLRTLEQKTGGGKRQQQQEQWQRQ